MGKFTENDRCQVMARAHKVLFPATGSEKRFEKMNDWITDCLTPFRDIL